MKYKRFRLDERHFIGMFLEGNEFHVRVVFGFPEDTKFVRWFQNNEGWIEIVVSSESFPELNSGDMIPEFQPIFESLND